MGFDPSLKRPTCLASLKCCDTTKQSVLTPSINCALYVNEFVICYRATHINIVERQLQINLNEINKWATENGFKSPKSKTQCVHFCSLRKMHNNPVIKIEDSKIPVVNEYKFLGVIFPKKTYIYPAHKIFKKQINPCPTTFASRCPHRVGSWSSNTY